MNVLPSPQALAGTRNRRRALTKMSTGPKVMRVIPGQIPLVVTFLLTAVMIVADVFAADWARTPD